MRGMNEDKRMTLSEAAKLVQPGQVLALGGMTLYRRPVAFVYEVLRRTDRQTDLMKLRPDVKTVHDPYSGEELVAFPAVHCDVAVIHALVADRSGNARLNQNRGVDLELSLVAKTVILTAEEIVDQLAINVDIV